MSCRRLLAVTVGLAAAAAAARAQGVSPNGAAEEARFLRVIKAVEGAGYPTAMVVGHGTGATDGFFALTASSRGDSGVLVVTVESGRAIVLERERTPADLGLYSVTMSPFLAMRSLYDIEVTHHPFRLEESYAFTTHHIVRRDGDALVVVCRLAGNSSASHSKGIGSSSSRRQVRIEAVSGRQPQFVVKVARRTTERAQPDAPPIVITADSAVQYLVDASGACHEIKPAAR